MSFIASIVEGHGERTALPVLLRRVASEIKGTYPRINPPYRVNSSSLKNFDAEFLKAIRYNAAQAPHHGGVVLILLDCEDDCPATLGSEILRQAKLVRDDVDYVVCLARREYETWLVFGAGSLAGVEGLPSDLVPPSDPESFRDAKGWLRDRMGKKYLETEHQETFTARVDLDGMMASPSFRRLVERILPYL